MDKARSPRPVLAERRSRAPFTLYRQVKSRRGRKILLRNWWVRFSAPGPDGKPKQHRVGLKTQDYDKAEKLAWDIVAERRNGKWAASGDPILDEVLQQYKRHLAATKAETTASGTWYTLRAFFEACFPNPKSSRLSEVTTKRISQFIERKRLEDRAKPWTVYGIRRALYGFFEYAITQHEFGCNPARGVKVPRVSPGRIDYLQAEEIPTVLDVLRHRDGLLYGAAAIAIYAGLRRSEVVWLTWADVDLLRRIIVVTFKCVGGKDYQPKTNRSRTVPISQSLLPILQSYPRSCEWVFPTSQGKRWSPNGLSDRLRETLRSQGMKHLFGTFRHTFGSQLAQKGMSLYKISQLMGNSEDVCREYYASLAPAKMQDEVEFR